MEAAFEDLCGEATFGGNESVSAFGGHLRYGTSSQFAVEHCAGWPKSSAHLLKGIIHSRLARTSAMRRLDAAKSSVGTGTKPCKDSVDTPRSLGTNSVAMDPKTFGR